MTRTALYRHFDADGTLIYVGVTANPLQRLAAHECGSAWIQEIARTDYEWFPTLALALAAEATAIRSERPRYNIRCAAEVRPREPRRRPRTPFGQWMRQTGARQVDVAAALNVSQPTVSKLARGAILPALTTANGIERLTSGAVPASSWTAPIAHAAE